MYYSQIVEKQSKEKTLKASREKRPFNYRENNKYHWFPSEIMKAKNNRANILKVPGRWGGQWAGLST